MKLADILRNSLYNQMIKAPQYKKGPLPGLLFHHIYKNNHHKAQSTNDSELLKNWQPFSPKDIIKCASRVKDIEFWQQAYNTQFVPITSKAYATGIIAFGAGDRLDLLKRWESELPVFLAESMMLYNYGLNSHITASVPPEFLEPLSICVDDCALNFDASSISRLEQLPNSSFELTSSELSRAQAIRNFILEEKVTKYNFLPTLKPNRHEIGPAHRKKILVIEQSYSDFAVLLQGGSTKSFELMLQTAIKENPNADIIVKRHPDLKSHQWHQYTPQNNVYFFDRPINPYTLFELVDKVYVFSSGAGFEALIAGFEALIAGKEVVVFGKPFYMGWGLTQDKAPHGRRFQKRTIDDLVWAVYLWYQRYKIILGKSIRPGTAEEALEQQVEIKKIIESKYL